MDSRWPPDTARESTIGDRRRPLVPATVLIGGGLGILTARRGARRSSGTLEERHVEGRSSRRTHRRRGPSRTVLLIVAFSPRCTATKPLRANA